jgi:hypothetical protein
MSQPTMRFREWTCTVEFRRYRHGGAMGIQPFDAEDGCPVATATVNPERPIPAGHVAVKSWSENAGMLEALIGARLVEDTGQRIPCGYTSAALCRLLLQPPR